MVKRSDEVKIAVMETLKYGPRSAPDIVLNLDMALDETLAHVVKALGDLEASGHVKCDTTATVMPLYRHACEHSLSDLRAKLLPHRDPVREGHEFEQHGTRNALRYRRPTQGADHDSDSG